MNENKVKPAELSDQELNRALAEKLGWVLGPNKDYGWPPGIKHRISYLESIPNYAGDLNAVHAAEEQFLSRFDHSPYMKSEKSFEIESRLIKVLGHTIPTFRAKARQRAEALLEVLG